MLSASPGSFSRRYRSAFTSAAGTASFDSGFSGYIDPPTLPAGTPAPRLAQSVPLALRCSLHFVRSRPKHSQQPRERIVEPVDHSLFQRNDRIVGDRDVFRADFRAALGDVAVADAVLLAKLRDAVGRIERIHLERCRVGQEPRTDELVVQPVIAQDMTDVLAQEALDALA